MYICTVQQTGSATRTPCDSNGTVDTIASTTTIMHNKDHPSPSPLTCHSSIHWSPSMHPRKYSWCASLGAQPPHRLCTTSTCCCCCVLHKTSAVLLLYAVRNSPNPPGAATAQDPRCAATAYCTRPIWCCYSSPRNHPALQLYAVRTPTGVQLLYHTKPTWCCQCMPHKTH
jgi:hypothetical protein